MRLLPKLRVGRHRVEIHLDPAPDLAVTPGPKLRRGVSKAVVGGRCGTGCAASPYWASAGVAWPPGSEYAAACSRKLSRASLTASAMASWGTFPYHSSMIVSHGNPRSTCSRTSETKILVPRNVSLP